MDSTAKRCINKFHATESGIRYDSKYDAYVIVTVRFSRSESYSYLFLLDHFVACECDDHILFNDINKKDRRIFHAMRHLFPF